MEDNGWNVKISPSTEIILFVIGLVCLILLVFGNTPLLPLSRYILPIVGVIAFIIRGVYLYRKRRIKRE
jgi:hypothetical protein